MIQRPPVCLLPEAPLRQRLAYVLTRNLLIAALLLGACLSLIKLGVDYLSVREQETTRVQRTLMAHQSAAALAAYNLDSVSARQVVNGLMQDETIVTARVRSDQGELAVDARAGVPVAAAVETVGWWPDYKTYTQNLYAPTSEGQRVGELMLIVDNREPLRHFLTRAALEFMTALFYALALAGLLLAVVHLTVTRHLNRLMQGLNRIDPNHPDERGLNFEGSLPRGELGQLVQRIQALLAAIAEHIGRRELAEKQLQNINQNLEQAVTERTQLLERANQELVATLGRLNNTQTRLLESEKLAAVGQLAAGVAHEINNPLAFVSSNVSALRTYLQDLLHLVACYENLESELKSESARQQLTKLKQTVDLDFIKTDLATLMQECGEGLERVRSIVAELRRFASNLDESWKEAHWSAASLDELFAEALAHQALPDTIWVDQAAGGSPVVECQPLAILQMFEQLIRNAVQAMEGKGLLSYGACADGEGVNLTLADSGCGIAEEHRHRIFDPFFTTRPVGQGRGLGLSAVYNTVQRHGGRIEVDSRPGEGACFSIWLPCHHAGTGPVGSEPVYDLAEGRPTASKSG